MHILFVDVAMRTDSPEMTDVEPMVNNFASSARTGRRNAVPDIQGSAATGGTSELPHRLEALSMKEGNMQNAHKISSTYLVLINPRLWISHPVI